jgi:hypothetical protein
LFFFVAVFYFLISLSSLTTPTLVFDPYIFMSKKYLENNKMWLANSIFCREKKMRNVHFLFSMFILYFVVCALRWKKKQQKINKKKLILFASPFEFKHAILLFNLSEKEREDRCICIIHVIIIIIFHLWCQTFLSFCLFHFYGFLHFPAPHFYYFVLRGRVW